MNKLMYVGIGLLVGGYVAGMVLCLINAAV